MIINLAAGSPVALVDWWYVASRRDAVENAAKPMVMVMVLLLTGLEEPDDVVKLVAGVVAGLVGDVMRLRRFDSDS